jgi:hypothetical protein
MNLHRTALPWLAAFAAGRRAARVACRTESVDDQTLAGSPRPGLAQMIDARRWSALQSATCRTKDRVAGRLTGRCSWARFRHLFTERVTLKCAGSRRAVSQKGPLGCGKPTWRLARVDAACLLPSPRGLFTGSAVDSEETIEGLRGRDATIHGIERNYR